MRVLRKWHAQQWYTINGVSSTFLHPYFDTQIPQIEKGQRTTARMTCRGDAKQVVANY